MILKKSIALDRLTLGVCYYPEHWDPALWPDDFRRMRELGLSIMRVGEFAWTIFEPSEGTFCFDLFDRALDQAHQAGLRVVMGTPSATPPAWLTHKYPEVLNVSRDGVQYQHGQRRHCNYNAPIYRELSARIVTQLAEHYRDHPAIVGWQIDNEINCEVNVFYSQADDAAFRAWLRDRYQTLESLNQAWGAVFWNQTYTDWDQVHLTRPTVSNSPNPHQFLDEKRFISDSAIGFVAMQADIVHRLAPNHWVTTNGMFGHLDSHRMTERCLDFISYDSYPDFSTILPEAPSEALRDRRWSFNLSVTRDISPHFCVMEQQSGGGGWVNRMAMPAPLPGQMRLWTYQSVAHGADAVLYFRWRTATMGTEIYWFGLNDWHNQPNRRIAEARQVGDEFARIGKDLVGADYVADVAILKDYDNEWDGEFDAWHGPLGKQSTPAWFKALQEAHIPANVLTLRADTKVEDLAGYRLLVYPHPAIMTDGTAAMIEEYVAAGGQLIFGCRTGYKDPSGQCPMRPLPGPVSDLCGVRVVDCTLVDAALEAPRIVWSGAGAARPVEAKGFNDVLEVVSNEAEVLGHYSGSYYAGAPAVVRRKVGNGAVYYYGAAFSTAAAAELIAVCGLTSPADGLLDLPGEVELSVRTQQETGRRFFILLNYSHAEQKLGVLTSLHDLLSGRILHGLTRIDPFDVLILEAAKS